MRRFVTTHCKVCINDAKTWHVKYHALHWPCKPKTETSLVPGKRTIDGWCTTYICFQLTCSLATRFALKSRQPHNSWWGMLVSSLGSGFLGCRKFSSRSSSSSGIEGLSFPVDWDVIRGSSNSCFPWCTKFSSRPSSSSGIEGSSFPARTIDEIWKYLKFVITISNGWLAFSTMRV